MTGFKPQTSGMEPTALPTEPQPLILCVSACLSICQFELNATSCCLLYGHNNLLRVLEYLLIGEPSENEQMKW